MLKLLFYSTPDCHSCKLIKNGVQDVCKEESVVFIERQPDDTISTVPTIILKDDNTVIDICEGVISMEKLRSIITDYKDTTDVEYDD